MTDELFCAITITARSRYLPYSLWKGNRVINAGHAMLINMQSYVILL